MRITINLYWFSESTPTLLLFVTIYQVSCLVIAMKEELEEKSDEIVEL